MKCAKIKNIAVQTCGGAPAPVDQSGMGTAGVKRAGLFNIAFKCTSDCFTSILQVTRN